MIALYYILGTIALVIILGIALYFIFEINMFGALVGLIEGIFDALADRDWDDWGD